MIRNIFSDEMDGGKNELKVYIKKGKHGTEIPTTLNDINKRYVIIFITKNRFGQTNRFQIVAEHDLSNNTYKEIGWCMVDQDFF